MGGGRRHREFEMGERRHKDLRVGDRNLSKRVVVHPRWGFQCVTSESIVFSNRFNWYLRSQRTWFFVYEEITTCLWARIHIDIICSCKHSKRAICISYIVLSCQILFGLRRPRTVRASCRRGRGLCSFWLIGYLIQIVEQATGKYSRANALFASLTFIVRRNVFVVVVNDEFV